MAQATAFYSIQWASAGCMPDNESDLIECRTRGDLVAAVNDAIDRFGMSGRARRQVDLVRVWRHIQTQGTAARAGFCIGDMNPGSLYILTFAGLSRAEWDELTRETEPA